MSVSHRWIFSPVSCQFEDWARFWEQPHRDFVWYSVGERMMAGETRGKPIRCRGKSLKSFLLLGNSLFWWNCEVGLCLLFLVCSCGLLEGRGAAGDGGGDGGSAIGRRSSDSNHLHVSLLQRHHLLEIKGQVYVHIMIFWMKMKKFCMFACLVVDCDWFLYAGPSGMLSENTGPWSCGVTSNSALGFWWFFGMI